MKAQTRRWQRASRWARGLMLGGALYACTDATAVEEPADPTLSDIQIDRERGEVRLPSRFINPTHVLEVVATHRNGPVHETVLEFDAEGPQIQAALLAIGCRPAGFWNVTGPEDFVKTQGDRLLAIVRWHANGEQHEYAAEALLQDGEFGFPSFVRGFSFGARAVPNPARETEAGDPPPIPRIVEVTLGGTTRRSARYSLLWHSTTSSSLEPWALPPAVNPMVVTNLTELVKEGVPVTLVLRRLKSERELIENLRASVVARELTERLDLYDRMAPVAAEIDRFKSEFVKIAEQLERLLDTNDSDSESRREEILSRRALARLRVEQVESGYLTLYALQEAARVEWVQRRPDIEPEFKEYVKSLFEDGFSYEPRAANHRVTIAQLQLDGLGLQHPRVLAVAKDIEALEKDRESRLNHRALLHWQARLAQAEKEAADDSDDDGFHRRLFALDVERHKLAALQINLEYRLLLLQGDELRALDKGQANAALAAGRAQEVARLELTVIAVQQKLFRLSEDVRWAELDLESKDPQIVRDAHAELRQHEKKGLQLKAELQTAQMAWDEARTDDSEAP